MVLTQESLSCVHECWHDKGGNFLAPEMILKRAFGSAKAFLLSSRITHVALRGYRLGFGPQFASAEVVASAQAEQELIAVRMSLTDAFLALSRQENAELAAMASTALLTTHDRTRGELLAGRSDSTVYEPGDVAHAELGAGPDSEPAKLAPMLGVRHLSNGLGSRNGYSIYVPEDYRPSKPCPLILFLHGKGMNGRIFLYLWLAAARSIGAILITPTSEFLDTLSWYQYRDLQGNTLSEKSLSGRTVCDRTDPDCDCTIDWGAALPRLLVLGLVQSVRQSHSVRPDRILLAGISEGANAAISMGLTSRTYPWTHVAAFEMGYGLPSRYAFNQKLSLVKRALLDVRLRIVHGEHDQVYPLTGPCG